MAKVELDVQMKITVDDEMRCRYVRIPIQEPFREIRV